MEHETIHDTEQSSELEERAKSQSEQITKDSQSNEKDFNRKSKKDHTKKKEKEKKKRKEKKKEKDNEKKEEEEIFSSIFKKMHNPMEPEDIESFSKSLQEDKTLFELKDHNENNVLHYCVKEDRFDIFTFLLENYKKDFLILMEKQNGKGQTPFFIACEEHNTKMIDEFFKLDSDAFDIPSSSSPLQRLCYYNDVDRIRRLLDILVKKKEESEENHEKVAGDNDENDTETEKREKIKNEDSESDSNEANESTKNENEDESNDDEQSERAKAKNQDSESESNNDNSEMEKQSEESDKHSQILKEKKEKEEKKRKEKEEKEKQMKRNEIIRELLERKDKEERTSLCYAVSSQYASRICCKYLAEFHVALCQKNKRVSPAYIAAYNCYDPITLAFQSFDTNGQVTIDTYTAKADLFKEKRSHNQQTVKPIYISYQRDKAKHDSNNDNDNSFDISNKSNKESESQTEHNKSTPFDKEDESKKDETKNEQVKPIDRNGFIIEDGDPKLEKMKHSKKRERYWMKLLSKIDPKPTGKEQKKDDNKQNKSVQNEGDGKKADEKSATEKSETKKDKNKEKQKGAKDKREAKESTETNDKSEISGTKTSTVDSKRNKKGKKEKEKDSDKSNQNKKKTKTKTTKKHIASNETEEKETTDNEVPTTDDETQQNDESGSKSKKQKVQKNANEGSESDDMSGSESSSDDDDDNDDDDNAKQGSTVIADKDSLTFFDEMRMHKAKWKKFIRHCFRGIPPTVRVKIWVSLSESKDDKVIYQPDDSKVSAPILLQIDADINRAYLKHEMFATRYGYGQVSLFNILRTYASLDAEIGYTQGMSDLGGFLLMYLPEKECFQTFYSILKKERYNLRECFKDGFPRVVEALSYQTQMLSEKKPKLYNHFKKIGLNEFSLNYVIEWYMLVFTRVLPYDISLRIFDLFIANGYFPLVIDVAMTLFDILEDDLFALTDGCIAMALLKKPENALKQKGITANMFMKQLKKNITKKKDFEALKLRAKKQEGK